MNRTSSLLAPIRPCWVEIRTQVLEDNYRFLAEIAAPHAELLAIVKANAYGHGLEICAPAVVRAGARWLGVTSVEEGLAARRACPDAEILAISGVFPGQGADVLRHKLTVVAWEPSHFDELESAAQKAAATTGTVPLHLEIDTGMSRQGVKVNAVESLLARFKRGSALHLDAVMTHLFAADEADGTVTREQLSRLEDALNHVRAAGSQPKWLNVGNSAALLGGQAAKIGELASRFGMRAMVRPGLALYGLAPEYDPGFAQNEPPPLAAARQRLQPVLIWKTQIVSVRSAAAGTVVGYNGTFVATEPMKLALLAVGYADGLDRKLGNNFSLLVRGQLAPLVGRISMDQAVVDVTEIPNAQAGDEVVILGPQGAESITAFNHARAAGTIPWEVFTRISARVARVSV